MESDENAQDDETLQTVIIDTSAFYAIVSSDDRFHDQAVTLFRRLTTEERRPSLVTTSYVIVEAQALIHRRLGFETARYWMRSLPGVVEVMWIDQRDHDEAWGNLEERGGVGLNLVDWTVVLAAKALSARVFAFDRGFAREGAFVLPEIRI